MPTDVQAPHDLPDPALGWRRAGIVAALFALYVIWGSTYYAMHVAMTWLPPFLMAGPRFVLAGALLFVALRARGAPLPTGRQWVGAGVVGALLLVCGNGLVAIGQRSIDTGVAATVVATMPLWTAAIGAAWGERPSAREIVGLLVGFAGVAVLQSGGSLSVLSVDAAALLLAPLAWAFGSHLSRRIALPAGAMASAAQMIVGGALMIGVAVLRGERPSGPPTVVAVSALAYLVVFGSIVGFSAYGYLLRNTRPAVATSYAYVNPLVALAIGAALAGETLTGTKLFACCLTIAGVVIVSRGRARARHRRVEVGREDAPASAPGERPDPP